MNERGRRVVSCSFLLCRGEGRRMAKCNKYTMGGLSGKCKNHKRGKGPDRVHRIRLASLRSCFQRPGQGQEQEAICFPSPLLSPSRFLWKLSSSPQSKRILHFLAANAFHTLQRGQNARGRYRNLLYEAKGIIRSTQLTAPSSSLRNSKSGNEASKIPKLYYFS